MAKEGEDGPKGAEIIDFAARKAAMRAKQDASTRAGGPDAIPVSPENLIQNASVIALSHLDLVFRLKDEGEHYGADRVFLDPKLSAKFNQYRAASADFLANKISASKGSSELGTEEEIEYTAAALCLIGLCYEKMQLNSEQDAKIVETLKKWYLLGD